MESFVTTAVDMFPRWFRAPMKREIFVLVICAVFFLVHLIFVTEVSFKVCSNNVFSAGVVNLTDHTRGRPPCDFSSLQGGIYVSQLSDFYGSTRACQDFSAICECVAIGWIFGGSRCTISSNCSPFKSKRRKTGKRFLPSVTPGSCFWMLLRR